MQPARLPALLFAAAITLLTDAANATDLLDTAATAGSFKTFLATAKAAGMTDSLHKQGPFPSLPTGDTITLTSDNGTVTFNGARFTHSDLKDDNGVIEVIDKVILP